MTSSSQGPPSQPGSPSEQPGSPSVTPETGPPEVPPLIPQSVAVVIALAITLVWVVGIVADAVSTQFELNPFVYVTMLGLAGSIFGSNFIKGMKG